MKKYFGEYIKQLRTEKGLTLTQLGAKLNLDSANLSKIENGKRDFDEKRLTQLAEVFNLDIQELKTDTGSHIANEGIHVPLINVGGTVWVTSNMTINNFRCAYFSNDLWVAGGDSGLCYSTDGRVWEQSNISSNYFCVLC